MLFPGVLVVFLKFSGKRYRSIILPAMLQQRNVAIRHTITIRKKGQLSQFEDISLLQNAVNRITANVLTNSITEENKIYALENVAEKLIKKSNITTSHGDSLLLKMRPSHF